MRGAFLSFARRLPPVAPAGQQPVGELTRQSARQPDRFGRLPARNRSGEVGSPAFHQRFERGRCRADPAGSRGRPPPRRMRSERRLRGQSPRVPCESSPECFSRWPTKPPRRRRSRWHATRPPPTAGDCARPTRARPRRTSQPESLPARCLAAYLQYGQKPGRWKTSLGQCPYPGNADGGGGSRAARARPGRDEEPVGRTATAGRGAAPRNPRGRAGCTAGRNAARRSPRAGRGARPP